MSKVVQVSTVTAKGQTTVPKAVRQALGVDCGGKLAFRIEPDGVTVANAEAEAGHDDPAIGAFLALLEKDIASGRNIRPLPTELEAVMRRLLERVEVDLDAPVEGEVEL
ncbi:MAG TPA: type II toxin-antitoxin system PrlF family antitoxin [Kiloniellales bacterium]|nr:type II toxin-antitoxin system PrlF family antitoxin [Kiloniellales bacterium]